jgi:uncharacterized protein
LTPRPTPGGRTGIAWARRSPPPLLRSGGGYGRRFAAAVLLALVALVALAAFISSAALAAEPNFPPLSGRVVDQANVLSADTRMALTAKLKDLEEKSGIQLVVATVSSLEGWEVEPYANELFRTWKLGEAKKNNGALFLIAPKDHKVRVEVGYGLEGTLTDATSKIIIANAVAPRFKAGDFNGGITRGVDDIITTLTTDSADWQKRPVLRPEDNMSGVIGLLIPAFILVVFIIIFIALVRQQGGIGRALLYMWLNSGNSRSGGFSGGGGFSSGGGSSSDSFSGGGGSSGGGGASGSW